MKFTQTQTQTQAAWWRWWLRQMGRGRLVAPATRRGRGWQVPPATRSRLAVSYGIVAAIGWLLRLRGRCWRRSTRDFFESIPGFAFHLFPLSLSAVKSWVLALVSVGATATSCLVVRSVSRSTTKCLQIFAACLYSCFAGYI